MKNKKVKIKNSELWNLDVTIAKFIYPRLDKFIKIQKNDFKKVGYNNIFIEKINNYKKMKQAFKLIIKYNGGIFSETDSLIIDEGIDIFNKYYFDLWI